MTQILYLVLTIALVLANGFFVASEFAIVKMRPTRLEQLVKEGNLRARLALRISQRLDAYLSANQLGITLASLALGWIGEPAIADLVEPLFAGLGAHARISAHGVALAISFVIITSLHTIIGELAPKSLAIQRTERIALATAVPLHVFFLMMWPVIWVLNGAANAFIRLFGLRPVHEDEMAHTSDELRMLLTKSPALLDAGLRAMLVRVFDLRRRTARHVMSLRSDAAVLRTGMTVEQAMDVADDAGYSRYPVLDPVGLRVRGYVHVRDLYSVLRGRRKAKHVSELLRQPVFARESTSVERLRSEMQARQVPVAVITTDDGELVGLATLEDLLEEIVGEIRDENDDEVPPIQRREPGIVEVDGRVLLADLERETGIVLLPPAKQVETVGGYVIGRLERPPAAGETLECEGHTVTAVDVAGRRIRRVRIAAHAPPPPPATDE